MDVWPVVQAERLALADRLETLAPPQWDAASRCSGWRVRDVAAHLVALPTMRLPAMVSGIVRARFDVDRWLDRDARRRAARLDPPALVAELRRCAANRRAAPGIGPRGPLTDTIVHGADIVEPLGLCPTAHEALTLAEALAFALSINTVFRSRSRATGLRLVATDIDWSSGTGPEVAGSALDVLSALCGRSAAAARLAGDGAPRLVERTSPSADS